MTISPVGPDDATAILFPAGGRIPCPCIPTAKSGDRWIMPGREPPPGEEYCKPDRF